jgi:hypothetical protein
LRNRIALVSALTFMLSLNLHAQDNDIFKLWPDSTLAKANSASHVDFLSETEKESIFYMNLLRINPRLFTETYFADYIKSKDIKKDKLVKDLIKELEETPKMNPLLPDKQLSDFAKAHAIDMGQSGRTGHNSSKGKPFRDRISDLEHHFMAINENCNYGNEDAVDAFIDLLIDRNVPNFGHRKNILDPEMKLVGVALEPHERWRFNYVQDFGIAK